MFFIILILTAIICFIIDIVKLIMKKKKFRWFALQWGALFLILWLLFL